MNRYGEVGRIAGDLPAFGASPRAFAPKASVYVSRLCQELTFSSRFLKLALDCAVFEGNPTNRGGKEKATSMQGRAQNRRGRSSTPAPGRCGGSAFLRRRPGGRPRAISERSAPPSAFSNGSTAVRRPERRKTSTNAARERLLAKINRIATGVEAEKACKAAKQAAAGLPRAADERSPAEVFYCNSQAG